MMRRLCVLRAGRRISALRKGRLAFAAALALCATPALAQVSGAAIYTENCSACHQATGKGIPGAFPGLIADGWVLGPTPALSSLLLNGRGGMPAFHDDLSDEKIAAVASYIRGSWGNHADPVTVADVAAVRGSKAMPPPNPLQAH